MHGAAWTEGPIVVATEGQLLVDGEAPDFLEPVRPVTVLVGKTAVLEGKISGTPKPEVKWYKNDELILPSTDSRYKIENLSDGTQRLTINNANIDDMDEYRCVLRIKSKLELIYRCEATNKFGDVWSDVTLTVQSNKNFIKPINLKTFKCIKILKSYKFVYYVNT